MAHWDRERSRLADRLRKHVSDEAVLAAIASVPRHRFVPDDKRHDAYADRPLPIGQVRRFLRRTWLQSCPSYWTCPRGIRC